MWSPPKISEKEVSERNNWIRQVAKEKEIDNLMRLTQQSGKREKEKA